MTDPIPNGFKHINHFGDPVTKLIEWPWQPGAYFFYDCFYRMDDRTYPFADGLYDGSNDGDYRSDDSNDGG